MGLEPIYAPFIVGGIGALTTGISVAQGIAQNNAIQAAMNANAQAAQGRQDDYVRQRDMVASQTMDARRVAHIQQMRQANQVEGRARAAAAQSGLSTGSGSTARGIGVIQSDSLFNSSLIDRNYSNQIMGINTNFESSVADNVWSFQTQMAQLSSQAQNPLLSGLMGALSGLGTGLQVGGGMQQLGWIKGP